MYVQITDNIPEYWEKQRERERQTQIKRRTYTRKNSDSIAKQG